VEASAYFVQHDQRFHFSVSLSPLLRSPPLLKFVAKGGIQKHRGAPKRMRGAMTMLPLPLLLLVIAVNRTGGDMRVISLFLSLPGLYFG
jgi:hypothetical protein